MDEAVPYGNKQITRPEEQDWTGELCTFCARVKDGAPVVDVGTGYIKPGPVKARGEVIDQKYLGPAGDGMIPDFAITVRCKSGDYVINLMDNQFTPVK